MGYTVDMNSNAGKKPFNIQRNTKKLKHSTDSLYWLRIRMGSRCRKWRRGVTMAEVGQKSPSPPVQNLNILRKRQNLSSCRCYIHFLVVFTIRSWNLREADDPSLVCRKVWSPPWWWVITPWSPWQEHHWGTQARLSISFTALWDSSSLTRLPAQMGCR